MTVSKSSWHYRLLRWVFEARLDGVTVCGYWARLIWTVISTPIALIVGVAIYPLVYLGEKLEAKLRGKTICPLGKMQYK